MAFLTVGKTVRDTEDNCTLYVMKFVLDDGTIVHKIGITCINPVDRLMQILRSFFVTYRYTPRASIKRYRKVPGHFTKETQLHREFADFSHRFDRIFDGCTEFFDVDQDTLLRRYDSMCDVDGISKGS